MKKQLLAVSLVLALLLAGCAKPAPTPRPTPSLTADEVAGIVKAWAIEHGSELGREWAARATAKAESQYEGIWSVTLTYNHTFDTFTYSERRKFADWERPESVRPDYASHTFYPGLGLEFR